MNSIPVILVAYNRTGHTSKVLESLRRHNVQNLYIFSDGPKGQQDLQQVLEVRQLLRQIDWCEPVIIEQPQNIGLAKSIVGAADYVFQKYDRLILLEDDCVPEEHFFDFMTTCLQKYENHPRIFGISGFSIAIPDEMVRSYPYDLYFCPRIGSHGWATWKRAWQHHGRNLRELIDTAISRGVDLDQGGSDIPVFISDLLQGKLKDVWTLNWVLSVYLNNGVYIYPTRSHITNIGMDGSGVHCGKSNRYDTPVCQHKTADYPQEVFLDEKIMRFWRKFYDVSLARRANVILPKSALAKPAHSSRDITVGFVSSNDIKGGAQRVGWVLKEGLKARGYRTRMFVGHKFSSDPDVKVIKDAICDGSDHYKKQGYLYYDINSTFKLGSQREFIECDIIHFHNLHGDYFNPLALPQLTKNKPSVWTLHDMQSMTGHCAYAFDCEKWQMGCGDCPHLEAYPSIIKDRTAEMWQHKKSIYDESDFELIVPSQWLKNIVEKSILREKKVHLIYNGIDQRIYKPLDRTACRRKFSVPDGSVVLCFVAHGGLLDPRKGGDFILAAYEYFIPRYKNVCFVCIGGKSDKAPRERFLQIPFVTDENLLAELYCATDVFVFPTLADNCPLVVLELMGCGVPVVSFNIGGVPELIENGKTGFIAGYKNGQEFIQMTEHLVLNKAKREEFSWAGLERFREMFTLDQMIDRHIQLYERLAEGGKKENYVSPANKMSLSTITGQKKYDYLVSAIVSTYNSERHIRACLEDLENQVVADKLEIIVVNSGSQQNEEAIVKEFQQKYNNIKYIRTEERETIYKAWNRAIKASSGKYITNANTDDRHTKNALERMAKALEANPDKVLVYGDHVDVNEIDEQRVAVGERINGQFSRHRLFSGQCPPGSQPMWRREVHNLLGYFDETFVVGGDYEFWFRLTQKFDFFYLNETLGERFISDEVVSRSNSDLALWENMIIRKSYECAHQRMITVGAEGISENPLFSIWPEVNIWKRMVKTKLTGAQPPQPTDNIKNCWDCRTNPKPRLTIVVVTFNRPRELLENLNSLNEQTEKNFEVIVVDNSGNLSELKSRAGEFNYGILGVELKCNFGPSPARNIGVRFAKAEYISFLDDDAVADRNLVSNVIRHFQEHDIAGMRGKILPKSKGNLENIPVPVDYDLGDKVIISACDAGAFSAFRKDVFLKACGFDEFLFGSEGIELSYRICKIHDKKVRSILYFPDVIVYHDYYRSEPACTEKTLRREWMQRLARRKEAEIIGYSEYIHSLYPTEKESVENDYSRILNIALYLRKDFHEEALKYAEKAVALEPDKIKGRYLLGVLYVELGRYDEAVAMLEPMFSTLLEQPQEFSSLSESDPEFENRAVMAECCLSAGTKLAQCYMKKGQYGKLRNVYTLLLNNPYLAIPQEQRASIQAILAKLQNVKDVPVQTAAPRTDTSVRYSLSPVSSANQADRTGDKYLVSAVVSVYNSEKFIRGCLEDLVNQTMADRLEIIVVNCGSQQNEEAIVKEFQRKYNNVKYIRTESRETVYQAWNRGIKAASGKYITNANTDDRHRKDALEIMAKTLEENPDVALVYSDQISTDTPNGTFENHHAVRILKQPDYSRERLLFGCCTGSQPMWRKSLHSEFGYFDEMLTCAGDWEFWLRIAKKYKFKHIPEFLGLYYHNPDGIEHGKEIHSLYERYIVGQRYGNPYISVIPQYECSGNPLVSVIMPAFNAADYIAEAIESVLIQNYGNFELVIVDDGSTDRTRDIIAGFRDPKIRYFYQANRGASCARNFALKQAGGQYIVLLDADDMITPDFIAQHLQELERHTNADLVYSDYCLIDENSKPIRVLKRPEYADEKLLIRDLFRCGFPVVQFNHTCLRKSVFDKIGFYDEKLIVGEDYDMIRRFLKCGLKVHHVGQVLYLRRMTNESLSRSFTAEKAKCHFEVVSRFAETFSPEELFPDIQWDKIPPEIRQLHAKCKAAATCLTIGQTYVRENMPDYAKRAFELACLQMKNCLEIAPENQQVRQMLERCESVKNEFSQIAQQAAC